MNKNLKLFFLPSFCYLTILTRANRARKRARWWANWNLIQLTNLPKPSNSLGKFQTPADPKSFAKSSPSQSFPAENFQTTSISMNTIVYDLNENTHSWSRLCLYKSVYRNLRLRLMSVVSFARRLLESSEGNNIAVSAGKRKIRFISWRNEAKLNQSNEKQKVSVEIFRQSVILFFGNLFSFSIFMRATTSVCREGIWNSPLRAFRSCKLLHL